MQDFPQIVKQADFSNPKDNRHIVLLDASYGEWLTHQFLAIFEASGHGEVTLQKYSVEVTSPDASVEVLSMSVAVMDRLVAAWQAYSIEYKKWYKEHQEHASER